MTYEFIATEEIALATAEGVRARMRFEKMIAKYGDDSTMADFWTKSPYEEKEVPNLHAAWWKGWELRGEKK